MASLDNNKDTPFFPGFETRQFSVDGVAIHAVTGGQGPALLLLHGSPQSHIMWRHLAPFLARSYRLVIPDLRGYGRSGKPARGDYSKRRMAADMVAVMDELGHEHFHIAGHDRGARVARRLVKDYPNRVDNAILIDIVPTAYVFSHMSPKVATNLWNWSLWAAPEPIPEGLLDPQTIAGLPAWAADIEPAALADYVATNGNPESLHALCEDYRAGASVDLEHDAADADRPIDRPLLVLTGERSTSTEQIFDVRQAWRGEGDDIRFATLDCGHFLPEEAPEETAKAMLTFLRDA